MIPLRPGKRGLRLAPLPLGITILSTLGLIPAPLLHAQEMNENLRNLTGSAKAQPLLIERETFGNEFRYEVRIRNQSPDPLKADSLLIVLDRIEDPTGKDVLARMNVLNADGTTKEGKPYFHLPSSQSDLLPPYMESQPVLIRIRNPDYLPQFVPVFQVWGLRRLSPSGSLNALVELLIKKGLLTESEWNAAIQNAQTPP